jgi:DNA mismatch repair protein MutS
MAIENQGIIQQYIDITNNSIIKYGQNTILLMQVGAFFEMYGLKTDSSNIYNGSRIEEICRMCDLNMSDKKICVGGESVYMAGFRDYSLDKYLKKITDNYYTAVVYVQDKQADGKINRIFQGSYSKGTYVNYETEASEQITNNVMCIWMDKIKNMNGGRENLVYGVSVADVFTGKTSLFEYETPFIMNPTSFDELERCFSVFSPSELILLTPFDDDVSNTILQYVGCSTRVIHKINTTDTQLVNVDNCSKQKHINHILTTFFGEDSVNSCVEFSNYALATQSFCYLLNFIQEHNPDLVKKIDAPTFNNASTRVILANHTLKQLNIINDTSLSGGSYGNLSSVSSFLNKACSPMGKRLMKHQFVNPCFDETWLNKEYDIIEKTLVVPEIVKAMRTRLRGVRDIDKILRQLVIKKLYPQSVCHLYNSVHDISHINDDLGECEYVCDYAHGNDNSREYMSDLMTRLLKFLNDNLIMEHCNNCQSTTSFDNNIIQPGVSLELDTMIDKRTNHIATIHGIKDDLNCRLRVFDNDKSGTTEYVKVHKTEKSGISLQITNKRGKVLKSMCKQDVTVSILENQYKLDEITLTKASGSCDDVNFKLLKTATGELHKLNGKIDSKIEDVYLDILTKIESSWFDTIDTISTYTAKLDVLQSKVHVATKYNYCKPTIDNTVDKSYASAKNIRHCLIEHLQTNELYVTNDISLGRDGNDGMLLYGVNMVGKTSIIRALGICVILAQSGMYVPCSAFDYKPYKAIYSRILGNDNLFKGLSTFAAEMSELRVILKSANENSLVLGDELVSGTENQSSHAIFVAALMRLSAVNASYIFATHLNEVAKYDEIKSIDTLRICHMNVIYDPSKETLIYDRKLKDGVGNTSYGLTVCKSLYLDSEFLDLAYSIRNKYFPMNQGELNHKPSVYNAKKVRGMCEMCKVEVSSDIHHMMFQQNANSNGFINSHHMNHKANLMSICKKCHLNIHSEGGGQLIRQKTNTGYILKDVLE